MIYGTKVLKNKKVRGYLHFQGGKKVVLSDSERFELELKIREWNYQAVEKYKENNNIK